MNSSPSAFTRWRWKAGIFPFAPAHRRWKTGSLVHQPLPASPITPSLGDDRPKVGESFLTLQHQWQDLILAGRKTLEMRDRRLKQGKWFFGYAGQISGYMQLGGGFVVRTDKHWCRLASQHCVPTRKRRYKKRQTWAHPILSAARIHPVFYKMHRGAIGTVVFEEGRPAAAAMSSMLPP